ncbi:MAG: aminopeptidase [Candidatus Heimdallarchaeota archaeon]|nr:aminopeptidase [Candidatus Heimdallarchaeota archaeon]MBY8994913.1 aminopeptidase [Candidatus Heimdallarchaeota archaeon]
MLFDVKNVYKKENLEASETYNKSTIEIKEILKEINETNDEEKNKYYDLLKKTAEFILKMIKYETQINNEYFLSKNFEDLKKENLELFHDILPENYESSYVNPTYCVKVFGEKIGQLMSYFCYTFRYYIDFAFKHKIFKIAEYNELFIDVYKYIKNNSIKYETLNEIITRLVRRLRIRDNTFRLMEVFDPQYRFYNEIVMSDDLTDLRYLFKTGKYISENEIKLAAFISKYPQEKLRMLAKAVVKAYFRGFERDGKDITKKSAVELIYPVGMEDLIREVINELESNNLQVIISNVKTKDPNRQSEFDHKFDRALYLNNKIKEQDLKSYTGGLENNKVIIKEQSGVIQFISFGEEPFSPINKEESLKLSEEQTKIFQAFYSEINQIHSQYQPRAETSFSIISFPSPDIGDNFEEIFDKIVEINMLDSDKYEKMQQIMIDALDQADHVLIKGKAENKTDLRIQLQKLANPEKETNFANSGANVNIPAGEIFTSPQLKGTNGVLHVDKSYLSSLLYENLTITFKEGYIADYSCSNFDTEEENKKYIEQNLLFPHKTLPIGEFAIGTNTLAYVVSREYNILPVLPVLISEKTAPHFAIGDTCFQMREDVKVYNRFTKKEIVACDNEKSILRKTDRKDEAYTFKHNDIVLPFQDIDFITAVTSDGTKINIIQNGKFSLKGIEELNIPLIEYEKKIASSQVK